MTEKYINPFTDYGFKKLFGEESNKDLLYNPDEQQKHQDSLKYYRDWKNALDTAKEETRKETKVEIAAQMKAQGLPDELIAIVTGLDMERQLSK